MLEGGWGQLCWPLLQILLYNPSAADRGSTSLFFPVFEIPLVQMELAKTQQHPSRKIQVCFSCAIRVKHIFLQELTVNILIVCIIYLPMGCSTGEGSALLELLAVLTRALRAWCCCFSTHTITSLSNLCRAGSALMREMKLHSSHKEKDKMQPTCFTAFCFLFLKLVLWTEVVLSVCYPREQQCRGKLPSLANTN